MSEEIKAKCAINIRFLGHTIKKTMRNPPPKELDMVIHDKQGNLHTMWFKYSKESRAYEFDSITPNQGKQIRENNGSNGKQWDWKKKK